MFTAVILIFSCKKYQDSAPVNDPRLTNPYCNDPAAVNYNWGFPGKADNTICFYPTDLFRGTYQYIDSVYLTSSNYFIYADTLILSIHSLSHTRISVFGFCGNGDSLNLTAVGYVSTIDSAVGDSVTARGQFLCRMADTVSGSISDNLLDTTLHIYFNVVSDTGLTYHMGRAKKL